jgi:hypothetical protein
MEYARWLQEQLDLVPRIQVEPGEYVAHYWPRSRKYTAAVKVAATSDPVVVVDTLPDGRVRATVRIGALEYVFEPDWILGRGLGVHRLSPLSANRPEADASRGYAIAALERATERAYSRLRNLAMDAAGDRWPELLSRLTLGAAPLGPDKDGLLAALRVRELPELMVVRHGCRCIGCGARLEQGAPGPVFELSRAITVCAPCYAGEERAA